jgi:hypothetical protein
MGGRGQDEKGEVSSWRNAVLSGPLNWEIEQGEDLANWLWKGFRDAFGAKPFLQTREVASPFEPAEPAPGSLPAVSLVFGRNESASIGIFKSVTRQCILHFRRSAR